MWLDNPLGLPGRLRPDGADVRPLRHPHARGGPQAPVHQQAGQRLGRHLADRLPGLDAHRPLPAGPLRPPQGGVRARRARHRLLRRLPLRPARRWRRRLVRDAVGISGWKNFTPAVQGRSGARLPADGRCRSSACRLLLWAVMWAATGRWWIYPLLWWLPWMTQWRVHQPAAGDRRARRPRGQSATGGSPPTTCARAGSPGSGSSPTTPVGTWPTTSTWASRGATCPAFHAELERAGYVTEGSPTRATGPVAGAGLGLTRHRDRPGDPADPARTQAGSPPRCAR